MTNRETGCAGDTGGDARHSADRHELPAGEVSRTTAGRADESNLRHRAAEQMGWTTLRVMSMDVDEQGQWAAMLALNRATHSMSVLEEALVLREMVAMGMTQTQIGQILNRHKSCVSRRIGLIERLHPELVEQIREGMLPPGAARRLLSLPAGNQLELATVVMHYGPGSQADLPPALERKKPCN